MKHGAGHQYRRNNTQRMRARHRYGMDPFLTAVKEHYRGPKPKELCTAKGCRVPAVGLGWYCENHLLRKLLEYVPVTSRDRPTD